MLSENTENKKIYIETYGCQMNVVDSETVMAIMLASGGFEPTADVQRADIILLNTCSIRDNAEQRIWHRLDELAGMKRRRNGLIIGLIGCMAERLRETILERRPAIDLIVGPDAYRDLPALVRRARKGEHGINTELSKEETYAEISPVRLDGVGVSAFVSIMRGCNNFCSYCVVPYTRGRERSRDPETILREVRELFDGGYREVTLLGQNVNSYSWSGGKGKGSCADDGDGDCAGGRDDQDREGDQDRDDERDGGGPYSGSESALCTPTEVVGFPEPLLPIGEDTGFPELLRRVAEVSPLLRVRFATSHPKDMSDELLAVMASKPNICRAIHLPAQSGSNRMLAAMNRKYTRERYLDRIGAIRRAMPDCAISTDLIAGFCGETAEDHAETLSLMSGVGYEFAFMFKYSERPDTVAAKTMPDDVPESVKTARLTEIIALQNSLSLESNKRDVGREFEILVEGTSKRSKDKVFGRTSQNKVVVILRTSAAGTAHRPGDYVKVRITGCSSATLQGEEVI